MFKKEPCEVCGKPVSTFYFKYKGKRLCEDCCRKAKGLGCEICGKPFPSLLGIRLGVKSKYCIDCLRANPELDLKAHEYWCRVGWIPSSESRDSCNGCAYLSSHEELTYVDSLFGSITSTEFKCEKLNMQIKGAVFNCPHRRTTEEVIAEKQDMETIESTWTCPYCNAVNKGNFCFNCGSARRK